ncbi:acyl-CoA dehydrogenase [Piscinibacter sakaiensis]|uniref:Butyryl-CoA dehydrogenase n=1 Tax=Piscinibacter sakaiensis TaxID=1547922 RepID=A0A0K8P5D8_PISS1|nr:acyl-CoA dehydrogenase [Piscinibacter sakaiensis]GAP37928.1 butyryl-CoA dehydrogenase [Piscinibacter sakaiensis]
MNYDLSEEQSQLRDSVRRMLADHYGFEQRRAIAASDAGWSTPVWRQLCELGVTALTLPEAHGGFGQGAADLLPVLEEFGRVMLLEPFLASSVLAATAVVRGGDAAAQDHWLAKLADGGTLLAFAHDEPAARHAPLWVETRATARGRGWGLSGTKSNVLHGSLAERLIVTARVRGEPGARDGLALFLVDPGAPGVTLREHRLVDGRLAARLDLADAEATPLGDPQDGGAAIAAIDATLDAGIAAVCAEAVGAMQAAHDMTLAYLNTRQQFGRVIGANQALRHRAAEMLVHLETARSAAIAAACAVDDPGSPDARADLHRAKMLIGRHGRQLAHAAIQLHGGIGMTYEYAVGHLLRRLTVLDQLFGDADAHAARLGQMIADQAAA